MRREKHNTAKACERTLVIFFPCISMYSDNFAMPLNLYPQVPGQTHAHPCTQCDRANPIFLTCGRTPHDDKKCEADVSHVYLDKK